MLNCQIKVSAIQAWSYPYNSLTVCRAITYSISCTLHPGLQPSILWILTHCLLRDLLSHWSSANPSAERFSNSFPKSLSSSSMTFPSCLPGLLFYREKRQNSAIRDLWKRLDVCGVPKYSPDILAGSSSIPRPEIRTTLPTCLAFSTSILSAKAPNS
jgi:hypothetical protein